MLKSFAAGVGVLYAIAAYIKLRKSKKREKDLKKKEEELNERIRRMNEMHPGVGTYLNDFFQAIVQAFGDKDWKLLQAVRKKCTSGDYGAAAKHFQFYANFAIVPILALLGIPFMGGDDDGGV
ncbi:MAG: hypothetical protein OXU94_03430 [Gammaproteobacteria bacterium]|nr:hypothetical protein [Gammaproteobacteria bacterium]